MPDPHLPADPPATPRPEPPPTGGPVLYIAGYGRSGSTVLDIALSAHPRIEGFGELAGLFAALADPTGDIDPLWDGFPPGPGRYRDAAAVVAGAEWLLRPWALAPWSRLGRRYLDLLRTTLTELRARTGAEVLVDSSKSSWRHAWRLPLLGRVEPNVHCLVLVRELGGVVRSVRSGRGDTQAPQRLPTTRAVIGWTLATVTAAATGLATCGRERTRLLRYERFAGAPGPTLEGIVGWIGLEPSPALADGLADGFHPGRQLDGNRVRHRSVIRIGSPTPVAPLGGPSGLVVRAVEALVGRVVGRLVPPLAGAGDDRPVEPVGRSARPPARG